MKEKEAIKLLRREGYKDIYSWNDKPNKIYPPHYHRTEIELIIVEGEMKIKVDNETKIYKPFERVYIPKREVHEAIIGENGCKYIIGEK